MAPSPKKEKKKTNTIFAMSQQPKGVHCCTIRASVKKLQLAPVLLEPRLCEPAQFKVSLEAPHAARSQELVQESLLCFLRLLRCEPPPRREPPSRLSCLWQASPENTKMMDSRMAVIPVEAVQVKSNHLSMVHLVHQRASWRRSL